MRMFYMLVTLLDGRKVSGVINARDEQDAERACYAAGGLAVYSVEAVRL